MFRELWEMQKNYFMWFHKYWKQYLGICGIMYGLVYVWYKRKTKQLELQLGDELNSLKKES